MGSNHSSYKGCFWSLSHGFLRIFFPTNLPYHTTIGQEGRSGGNQRCCRHCSEPQLFKGITIKVNDLVGKGKPKQLCKSCLSNGFIHIILLFTRNIGDDDGHIYIYIYIDIVHLVGSTTIQISFTYKQLKVATAMTYDERKGIQLTLDKPWSNPAFQLEIILPIYLLDLLV